MSRKVSRIERFCNILTAVRANIFVVETTLNHFRFVDFILMDHYLSLFGLLNKTASVAFPLSKLLITHCSKLYHSICYIQTKSYFTSALNTLFPYLIFFHRLTQFKKFLKCLVRKLLRRLHVSEFRLLQERLSKRGRKINFSISFLNILGVRR